MDGIYIKLLPSPRYELTGLAYIQVNILYKLNLNILLFTYTMSIILTILDGISPIR